MATATASPISQVSKQRHKDSETLSGHCTVGERQVREGSGSDAQAGERTPGAEEYQHIQKHPGRVQQKQPEQRLRCDLGREVEVTGWQDVYSLIPAADALSGSAPGSGGSEKCVRGTVSLKPAARGL